MEALRKCTAAGYANFTSIRDDTDLNALRDRTDFQDFLLDLGFPTDPFARGE
jgi:hypothetical protein